MSPSFVNLRDREALAPSLDCKLEILWNDFGTMLEG